MELLVPVWLLTVGCVIFLGVPIVWSHLKMDKMSELYSAERTIILEAQMMHDLLVELMGLEPWPSCQLHLSILTVMVCTTYEVHWKKLNVAQQLYDLVCHCATMFSSPKFSKIASYSLSCLPAADCLEEIREHSCGATVSIQVA